MSETFPSQPEQKKNEREPRIAEIIALAKELIERGEKFLFPGINSAEYQKIKATEDEFTGYTTPIDELIERFKNEGMKVVLGAHPESGNVYILPAQSNNIEMDSIVPKQLQIDNVTDETLRRLILVDRS